MDRVANIVIVDDDARCIDHLVDSLTVFDGLHIEGVAQTAALGKELILKCRPDLVFLDVELPDMSGIELLRNLNSMVNWSMQVVFCTAYDKYLLDALRQSAFDYMLKPFELDELAQVMDRFFGLCRQGKLVAPFSDEFNRAFPGQKTLMITTVDGFRVLNLEQVGYFRYLNDKKRWLVMLSDLTEIQLKKNTTACDILKYSNSFMRINRDQIINISYLSMVKGKECILCPPFGQVKGLTASSNFIGQLQERFRLM